MKSKGNIFKWIQKNKAWLFSGIGITILLIAFSMFINKAVDKIDDSNGSDAFDQDNISNIEINGNIVEDIFQNNTINIDIAENNSKSGTMISDNLIQDENNAKED